MTIIIAKVLLVGFAFAMAFVCAAYTEADRPGPANVFAVLSLACGLVAAFL